MKNPFAPAPAAPRTLRVLARLLSYPDEALRAHAADMARADAPTPKMNPR